MRNMFSYRERRKKSLCLFISGNSTKKIHYICLLNNSIFMRKILLAFLISAFALHMAGQAPFPDKDEIKQFAASKTCIVLEDSPFSSYNDFIKEAVNTSWTIT